MAKPGSPFENRSTNKEAAWNRSGYDKGHDCDEFDILRNLLSQI